MAIVRARQPALTRVLPHQGNRRFYVPNYLAGDFLLTGDSWTEYSVGTGAYADFLSETESFTFTNQGINGSTVSDATGPSPLALRIGAELAAQPGLKACVVCTGGGNDIIRKWNGLNTITLANIQSGIAFIANAIVSAGAVPILADIPTTSLYDPDPLDCLGLIADVSAWMRDYCADNGYPFIPLYTTFCDGAAGIKDEYGGLAATHLNIAGQQLLAQMVLQALRQVR